MLKLPHCAGHVSVNSLYLKHGDLLGYSLTAVARLSSGELIATESWAGPGNEATLTAVARLSSGELSVLPQILGTLTSQPLRILIPAQLCYILGSRRS